MRQLLLRIGVPVGKYWICKRSPFHAYEAMECLGGNGVIEDFITARLYRDAPINAIWEGSGNVQALDVLRALSRTPEALEAWLLEPPRAWDLPVLRSPPSQWPDRRLPTVAALAFRSGRGQRARTRGDLGVGAATARAG